MNYEQKIREDLLSGHPIDDKLELLSVAIYMCNEWTLTEAMDLFGERRGAELFVEYINLKSEMKFICQLNPDEYKKFVNRACSKYRGRTKKIPKYNTLHI